MRRLIVTLLTATMLLPTAAGAEDRGERRARAVDRGDAPAVGEARQRPWRDQMQPAAGGADDGQRADRAQNRRADQPGSDRPRPDQSRNEQSRPDQPRPAPRQDDGRGNDGRWNTGGRPGQPDRDRSDRTGADWSRGGVNGGGRYGIVGRDGIDPRRDDDRRRDGFQNGNRRDDGRRDDRRWDDRRGGSTWYSDRNDGNRGGWNRGWRGNTRYDWARYRTANRNAYRLPRYYAPSGWGGYRRFGIGTTVASGLWGQNYWIADPFAYRLPEAYGPYRWVRYYGDALLIDLRTGLVVDSVYDIFW